MNKKKNYNWYILLFSLYIYPFYLKNLEVLGYLVIYLIPALYVIVHLNKYKRLFESANITQIISMFGIGIMLLLSIIIPIVYETKDFSYIAIVFAIIRKFIVYIFLFLVLAESKYKQEENVAIWFMQLYIKATIAYVMVTVLFVIIKPLQEAWMNIISDALYETLRGNYGYALRVGWQGFSGYRNTFSCSLSVLFVLFLLNYMDKKGTFCFRNLFYYISLFISFIGNMFYGRTGMLCSFGIIIFYIIYNRMVSVKTVIKFLILLLIIIFSLFVIKEKIPMVNDWFYWATSPFVNLYKTGKINNYSYDMVTKKMIFMPSLETFLVGDGKYTNSDTTYYMQTDVGFMRGILFWGIFGVIIAYLTVVNSIMSLGKKQKCLNIGFLIIFLIYEIKGEIYYEIIPLALALGYAMKYDYRFSKII